MTAKSIMTILFSMMFTFCAGNISGEKEKIEGRQLFGGAGFPGPLAGSQFLGQLGQYIQQGLGQYLQPGLGQYPQAGAPQQFYQNNYPPPGSTSFIEALTSIARYDDLKCVPRLLCEVAAGGRPGFSGSREIGGIPFLNKDTLMTLLTVFNFGGSTSPLMTFGRAILLGITAKSDPNTCFSAYPLCPRNPDNLVDYLNNHNGGFFKFFSGQRPYIPSRPYGRIQNGVHHVANPSGTHQEYPVQRPNRGPKQLQFPNVYPPPMTQNVNSFRDPDYFRKEKLSLLFPNNENVQEIPESNYFDNNESANSATNTFYFPENVNNQESHKYYVNEQPSNSPANTFYFSGNLNNEQSFVSNVYDKKQPSKFPRKTRFFPNNSEQTADTNFYNHREPVKSVYFPENEKNINHFLPERPVEDFKKQTSPMKFPDQTGNGNFRFDSGKINGQVLSGPITKFSGSRKPNFIFGHERSQSHNLAKNSEKREKRNKREELDKTTTEIPSNHKANVDEYEIIEDNEESIKYSSDDTYGIEE